MEAVDKAIKALINDIVNEDPSTKQPVFASNTECERRLLALLLAYSLGEELADKVIGDSNAA